MKILFLVLIICALIFFYLKNIINLHLKDKTPKAAKQVQTDTNPMAIDTMRGANYSGSEVTIEQSLPQNKNYKQYIASYKSQGLKIYALLTVPVGDKPKDGWPVIIFNHGYIPPDQYQTTERYVAYVNAFAASGYIVFKPDYRGNGKSEGQPEGAYYSPAYAVDVLNAISSIKKLPEANPGKIGMWGHSMGGNVTLRDLEISSDIKAAVIWGGVVGSYNDLMNNWHRNVPFHPSEREMVTRNSTRQNFINKYGTPQTNPTFWNAMDPFYNLNYISAPIQLDHGLADEEVPVLFSQNLNDSLKAAGKTVEFYTYPGADHNISGPSFDIAIQRSVRFFDSYLK